METQTILISIITYALLLIVTIAYSFAAYFLAKKALTLQGEMKNKVLYIIKAFTMFSGVLQIGLLMMLTILHIYSGVPLPFGVVIFLLGFYNLILLILALMSFWVEVKKCQ